MPPRGSFPGPLISILNGNCDQDPWLAAIWDSLLETARARDCSYLGRQASEIIYSLGRLIVKEADE